MWEWVTGEEWTDFIPGSYFDNAYGVEHYLQIHRVNRKLSGDGIGNWNDAPNDNYLEKEKDFYSLSHVGFIFEQGEPKRSEYTVNGLTATYKGHTYTLVEDSLTWQEAEAACRQQGGYLATVTGKTENELIKALIKNGSQKAVYWLGGTDSEDEGNWKWVTGEEWSYVSDNHKFDNSYENEHYLQIQRETIEGHAFGFWNDCNNTNTISRLSYFYNSDNVGDILETGDEMLEREETSFEDAPIIYVKGRSNIYNAAGKYLYVENTEDIPDVILELKDELIDAIKTGDWNTYRQLLTEKLSEKFGDYCLNNEGEVDNGSHGAFTWSYDSVPTIQKDIYSYFFEYDCRRDPWDIAGELHEYINCVKEKTGSNKIHLLSRCLGCNIVSAYLARYGYDDVLTNTFFASAAKGFDYESEMFSGKFSIKGDSFARYAEQGLDVGDSKYVAEFVKATVLLCNDIGIIDPTTAVGMKLFDRIKQEIIPTMLLNTFATCPGYWSMINDKNYEAAKEFIFGDEINTTYKKLVEKIDRYHYSVMNNLDNTLLEMKKSGINMYILCKYGFQCSPFIQSSQKPSDDTVDLYSQSFGARCADMGKTFTKLYILKSRINGTYKYISPDRQIDSSTAMFKDATWYVKNMHHSPFFDCFNPLLQKLCYSEKQLTVFDDSAYPQYLFYNDQNSTCEPLDKSNQNYNDTPKKSFFVYLYEFYKALFDFLKNS
ncbi:MAG: hypothetical protein MJ177_05855 [Clostridia bacterium]|nr:hypothetical protein [Clostridia bacterium]